MRGIFVIKSKKLKKSKSLNLFFPIHFFQKPQVFCFKEENFSTLSFSLAIIVDPSFRPLPSKVSTTGNLCRQTSLSGERFRSGQSHQTTSSNNLELLCCSTHVVSLCVSSQCVGVFENCLLHSMCWLGPPVCITRLYLMQLGFRSSSWKFQSALRTVFFTVQ